MQRGCLSPQSGDIPYVANHPERETGFATQRSYRSCFRNAELNAGINANAIPAGLYLCVSINIESNGDIV